MRRNGVPVAVMLLATTAAAQPPPAVATRPLAAERDREAIDRMRWRVQDTRRPVTTGEIAAMEPVVAALAADLVDPMVPWNGKRPALQALQWLRHAAEPAIPALVTTLDLYPDDNGPQGVGHFCEVADTLAAVGPTDERGIRALADWLGTGVRRHSLCHRCGCALRALAAAGPAARQIAGPAIERLAASRVLMSDDFQLGKTLAAVGIGAPMSDTLMDRVADESVSTYDRAGTLRALGGQEIRDPGRLLHLCDSLLHHRDRGLREAAAETLGALGPAALPPLRRALDDADHRVRARAVASLARLGPAAAPAAPEVVVALDPFRGTAADAIAALVAMGNEAVPALVARERDAPPWLRPLVRAAADSVRTRSAAPALAALGQVPKGPGGHGFVRVEVRSAGRGPTFQVQAHRARLRVKGGAVGPGADGRPQFDHIVEGTGGPNTLFHAVSGRREGDALRVVLSPEIAQSPFQGTERAGEDDRFRNAVPEGVAAAYDVVIERVCRPVRWRPLRGYGWLDFDMEVWCRAVTD